MENLFSQDGTMVRSDLSFLNLENFSSPSTMPITTVSPQLPEPTIAKRLSLVVWREKSEFGELVDKPKSWKVPSRNTEEEFQISRLTLKILKLFLPHTMDHASSGILSTTPE
jgi:hypothetical protein